MRAHYLRHQIHPENFDKHPLLWDSVFEREQPLSVEIGFGNGGFMEQLATDNPETNFVGIELSMESMKRLLKRIDKHGFQNVVAVHDDARWVLRECFADQSVEQIFMNYPDPWPKDKHRNRRLIDHQFCETLACILKLSGEYVLVTDQDWYAETALEVFNESPHFEVAPIEVNPAAPPGTKYELKWQEIGRNTHRVVATKKSHLHVKRVLENSEMPHKFVDRAITSDAIKSLVNNEHREADILFSVKDAYHDLSQNRYLIRTVAKDASYQQSFFVIVAEEKSGRWLVKLDASNPPYRTPSVKNAIWKIGEWLGADPGNE